MLRTHTCGELREEHEAEIVTLAGWVHTIRTHGNVTFVDLRDRYGITQLVFSEAVSVPRESVIQVTGTVAVKPQANEKLETGAIEVKVTDYAVLNEAEVMPIDENATEDTRLQYRYLDLRRPHIQKKLLVRHKAAQAAREYLSGQGFTEIETPLLIKSTPEGARDYVVPSRVNNGRFYALPQSPQLYKQLLMVAGFDKYFQLARCLRDEDLRSDRQPEHTQIDCELSFVHLEDLWANWEGLMSHLFKEVLDIELETPFKRIPYDESMDLYGIDKPDIRFDLHLKTITELAHKTEFKVFTGAEMVRALAVPKQFSRKEIDKLTDFAKIYGAKGLAFTQVTEDGLEGGIAKFIENISEELLESTGAQPGDTIFFAADKPKIAHEVLGQLRKKMGADLELYDPSEFAFCFITEFPLFEYDDDEDCWEPSHHLFCQPLPGHEELLTTDPGSVKCTQYDLVLNGVELGSGSIRITDQKLQQQVFSVIGLSEEEQQEKFGFLLEAFKYGVPPHGGIGLGFDRIVALMQGFNDIREVIAFPKNKNAQNPMDGSPGTISAEQLDELGITKKPRSE